MSDFKELTVEQFKQLIKSITFKNEEEIRKTAARILLNTFQDGGTYYYQDDSTIMTEAKKLLVNEMLDSKVEPHTGSVLFPKHNLNLVFKNEKGTYTSVFNLNSCCWMDDFKDFGAANDYIQE